MKKIIIIVCFIILNGPALQAEEFNPLDVEFGTDLEQLILENADFFRKIEDFRETENRKSYVSAFGLSASGEGPYYKSIVLYEVNKEKKIKGICIIFNYFPEYDPDLPQRIFNRIEEMDNNTLIRPERHLDGTTQKIEWRHEDYSYEMIMNGRPAFRGSSMFGIELYKKTND